MTIKQVAIDLLSKLGIETTDPTSASAGAQQDVVVAINGAQQMLQTAGQDFFTRETITMVIAAGTSVFNVPRSVQAVLGPLRLDGAPLRALESRGELDQFARIFSGETEYGAGTGTPIAYWPENIRSGTAGDINLVRLWLAPVPDASGSLEVEVVNDAPSIAASNLGDTTEIPVAQNYAESVFLPIARHLIMLSSLFSRPDLRTQIADDYQVAIATLGLKGGFPNAVAPAPEREVTA